MLFFFVFLITNYYLLITSNVAFGADSPPVETTPIITDIGQVQTAAEKIVVWLYGMFWIVAVGFIIWAAFLFMGANGEAEKITKAKTILVYTLIAAAVVLLANGIRDIVTNLLGGN